MDGRQIEQPRGKVLGGSSSLNAMVYIRGHAKDYDRWVDEGAKGWSYSEVGWCGVHGAEAYCAVEYSSISSVTPIMALFVSKLS